MKKFRLIAAAAIAGVATMLSSGTAHAAGYPDPAIKIVIPDSDLIGGQTFSFEVTSGSVDCNWTITYSDGRAPGESAVRTGSGTSISGSYKTKVVSSVFRSPIKAVCSYDDKKGVASTDEGSTAPAFFSTADRSSTVQAATATAAASATITLRPLGSGDGSALPDTGGSNLSLFLLAGGLVLVGGGVTYMARRRQSSH